MEYRVSQNGMCGHAGDERFNSMSSITASIMNNNSMELNCILKHYSDLNNASEVYDTKKRTWRLETPLITACRLGHLAMVQILVSSGKYKKHGKVQNALTCTH